MIVQVAFPGSSRAYTYEADEALGLRVGDTVEVPATALTPRPQRARVVALGSAYRGPMARVTRVLDEEEGSRR